VRSGRRRSGVFIIKTSTVLGSHRKGFGLFWTWKIRRASPGRALVPTEVRDLIRLISRENPIWGAPKIHGELLKLRIEIGETSVSKYMVLRRRPPSQTWRTFLENHVKSMVSVDFFTVPTVRFQVLYVFLVLAHERRRIVHFAVTAHRTAEWTAQQMREAFPWESAPRYLLRDRDRIFGKDFVDQVRVMGIKQVLSAPRSPWQRAYVERVIGTIRREYLDHMIIFNERCLYRHLKASRSIIIAAAHTWHGKKTARSLDQSKRQTLDGSSRVVKLLRRHGSSISINRRAVVCKKP
jgi:putative transposase